MVNSRLGCVVTNYNSIAVVNNFIHWLKVAEGLFDEIIIVDDNSTDGSIDVICKNIEGIEQIKVIKFEENTGRPSIPRNVGIKRINCDNIMLLDIDDLVPISWIHFVRSQKITDILTATKLPMQDTGGFPFQKIFEIHKPKIISKRNMISKNYVTYSGTVLPAKVAKRHKFENRFLEDWIYWNEIIRSEDVEVQKYTNVPIAYYSKPTLSPGKFKQLKRIISIIGPWKIPGYITNTLKLKFIERALYKKWY